MFFYSVLVERKLPQVFLTYSSKEKIDNGQLVKVPIGSSEIAGVIYCEVKSENLDISRIKEISASYPLVLEHFQLEYIKLFGYNTLNSLNDVFKACWLPLKNFSQKDQISLSEFLTIKKNRLKDTQNGSKASKNAEIEKSEISDRPRKPVDISFTLDPQIFLRIMILIRNVVSKSTGETLILFPEKKYLERALTVISQEMNETDSFELLSYTGDNKKSNRNTVLEILNPRDSQSKIICTTRAGLFLPYQSLKQIILVDESNSFYIQDQNQLYYDARDAAVQLAQSWNAKMDFLSTVPSIRLHSLYSESILKDWSDDMSSDNTKHPKITSKERIPFSKDFSYIFSLLSEEHLAVHEIQEEETELTSEELAELNREIT